VSDERPKRGTPADPATIMQSLFPGLAWTQAMIEGTQRAQAGLAADALRQMNAPVVEALNRHRELAKALADAAHQMATMASQVEELAKQHAAITAQMQAAMEPYLRYVEWLDRESKRQPPKTG
jgi:methyl-accepting chemotaxis protein